MDLLNFYSKIPASSVRPLRAKYLLPLLFSLFLLGDNSVRADKENSLFKNKITEVPREPVNIIVEAEDFDNLKVYPDFHREKGQGFYVKEHTHASGRAFAVCDSESEAARMLKVFDRNFPPGNYLIGAQIVLTRWTKNRRTDYGAPSGNIVRIELGKADKTGFTPVAILKLYPFFGSGYSFIPCLKSSSTAYIENTANGFVKEKNSIVLEDPVVKANSDWNALRITAEEIASGGIGDVPEFSLPYIIIDKVKISNEPGYEWKKGLKSKYDLTLASEKKEGKITAASTPEKKNADENRKKYKGNLVTDGSFEAGGRPYWNPGMDGEDDFTFDVGDIIEGDAPHGKRYARMQAVQAGAYPDDYKGAKKYRAGIGSKYFEIPIEGCDISFQARAYKPDTKLSLKIVKWSGSPLKGKREQIAVKEFKIGNEWKKYDYEFRSGKPEEIALLFALESEEPGATLELDAVQAYVPAEKAHPLYMEGEGASVLVAVLAPYSAFHDNENIKFEAVLVNDTETQKEFKLKYTVKDVAGNTYGSGDLKISGGKGVSRKSFEFDNFNGYGNFMLTAKTDDGKILNVPFSRIQNPAAMEKASKHPVYLGALGRNIRERSGKMLRHYGYEFVTTLNDVVIKADQTCRGYHDHALYRNEVEKNINSGLKWIPWIFPVQLPPYDVPVYSDTPAANGGKPWMSPEFGAWYVQSVLENYKGLYYNMIILTDELTNNMSARSALPYLLATYKAVKEKYPDVEVMNSFEFLPAEAYKKEIGKVKGKITDTYGGSRYNTGKWWYVRENRFNKENNLPFFIDGVGWYYNCADIQQFDKTGNPLSAAKYYDYFNEQAWDLAVITSIYRPVRYSVYVGKYGMYATDPFNQFSIYDGRPTFAAAQWIILEQFMREAEAGGLLFPDRASNIEVCYFTIKDMTWVVLHAPAPALLKELKLGIDPKELTVLDFHLAPLNPEKIIMKRGQTLFIGSKNRKLLEAVKKMQVIDLLETRFIIARKNDQTECIGFIKNNTAETLSGKLTMYKDMLYKKSPEIFDFNVKPGEWKIFTSIQDKGVFDGRAISNYPVYAQLEINDFFSTAVEEKTDELLVNTAEGNYMKSGDFFWLHYAEPEKSGKFDLTLLEQWEKLQSPASVYVNWGLNGSYQRCQIRCGGENTDPNMQLDGSMEHDYMSRHFIRYDDKYFYVGGIIEDELIIPEKTDIPGDWNESVEYVFQPDLMKNIGNRESKNLFKLKVVFIKNDKADAEFLLPDGNKIKVETVSRAEKFQRRYIARIPLERSGFGVKKGETFGFDISCRDSDSKDGKLEAEYDWSGASFAKDDVFGYGQLIFK
ncbi:MAG: hypothetical protein UT30_C0008G0041 [Candidatus Uhrbacteria bacterium GW2011_GWF2_39_13]|uniref:Uncharacterized protein n=1 Tax=Candidatus Uhrbacteria bacterium GW2011_GWF2_39_13 TaxID=1618995 RepID=A0A0G0MK52_9BACT|nr:MAG: hypothetical protein UT30_C0008G0041 [Candidatus Uhrbacteria bacterium GW2011_GWF2_39_13]